MQAPGEKIHAPSKIFSEKAKVFLTCADINEEYCAAPDYGGDIRR
jgi:hypothetical protein